MLGYTRFGSTYLSLRIKYLLKYVLEYRYLMVPGQNFIMWGFFDPFNVELLLILVNVHFMIRNVLT